VSNTLPSEEVSRQYHEPLSKFTRACERPSAEEVIRLKSLSEEISSFKISSGGRFTLFQVKSTALGPFALFR
jgi:hypothetical protein